MKYKVTIYDDFFNKEFTATGDFDSKEEAIRILKDEYAYELDTTPEDINIVKIETI